MKLRNTTLLVALVCTLTTTSAMAQHLPSRDAITSIGIGCNANNFTTNKSQLNYTFSIEQFRKPTAAPWSVSWQFALSSYNNGEFRNLLYNFNTFADWNFTLDDEYTPFVGIGIGGSIESLFQQFLNMLKSLLSLATPNPNDYMEDHTFFSVTPRFGLYATDHLRISAELQITSQKQYFAMLSVGLRFNSNKWLNFFD